MNNFIVVKEPSNVLRSYNKILSEDWSHLEAVNRFNLFKKMSVEISAYRKFLKENKFDFKKVKTVADILEVPSVSKINYFKAYSLSDKTWPGHSSNALVATSTSGSTGSPTYFVRSAELDWQYSILAEYFIRNGSKGSTLLIDCFGMGVWIGGLITYQAFYYAANRIGNITIITPGINKKEIFSTLKNLAPQYKNIIFAGYPPFIKDIIDEAQLEGIKLKKWNCRFLFAAESFTETFRDYIAEASGLGNIYKDTLNIYGTAELGAMAFETPGTILIRRLALTHREVFNDLFSSKKIPTLAQYNPTFVSFEEQNGEILITANSTTPFFRYKVGDSGGVYNLNQIIEVFKKYNINLSLEAKKLNVDLLKLPFVYVYERNDFSTTLYGLQIYPQTIKRALENRSLNQRISGKFSLETVYDKKNNQYLKINIELKPSQKADRKLYKAVEKVVINNLLSENSEYRELTGMLRIGRTKPRLVFWPYNDHHYFKSGIKQQWLKK